MFFYFYLGELDNILFGWLLFNVLVLGGKKFIFWLNIQ
ncbi:hypothetical protein N473_15165 [Pseudoalteromonas luteoviolacea CPMOR-1]|uniref:Uncharacterized protein n=1 Tax=Pseudoalteromonas luteoviolacea CPMOR-1 TaxID=1365248 RepID=A0A167LCB7_9GAMM|nr:hypothetical protein N473_15165 [Pseudoalteromonas luteoviolacea CPMOR-1]